MSKNESSPTELLASVGTFGDHVDGAPLTFALLRLDSPRIRRLLALIADFDAGVRAGRVHRPEHRSLTEAEADLLPEFIPRKATQRNPYYTIFRQARRDFDDLLRSRLYDPRLVAHIPRVETKDGQITLAAESVSFSATHRMPERLTHTEHLTVHDLYVALMMLTPPAEQPDLIEEIAERAPQTLLRLLSDEPVRYYAPEGRLEFRLAPEVKLDAARVARIMETGGAAVRERMVERLSRILDRPAQEWLVPGLPHGQRRGR